MATSSENWSMVGPGLDSLRPDCHALIRGAQSPDPADFDDLPWIEATYTADGRHVVALISDEWNAFRHPETALAQADGCTDPHQQACYFYAITEALSADGGAHFAYPPRRRVVAAPPEPFRPERTAQGSHGFATVSNLFAVGSYVYAFLGARGGGSQPAGNCLIRTRTPADPGSWRAWDGLGFSMRFVDPYHAAAKRVAAHACRPIAVPGDQSEEVRSVSWFPAARTFVAIVRGVLTSAGAQRPVAGFFFSTSPDLLHWSRPGLILRIALQRECRPLAFYPAMLDPASADRNFATVTNAPYLYYSRFNIAPPQCRGTMDRDLVRIRLRLAGNPARPGAD